MVSSITQDEFACYLNNSPYCFYRKCIREGSKGEITLPTDFSRYVTQVVVYFCYIWQAIVFIVGGGNYIEYQNLMDYSQVGRALMN